MKKLFLFSVILSSILITACSGSESCTCTVKYYNSADSLTGSKTTYETIDGSKCSNGDKTVVSNGVTAITTCK